MMRKQWEDGVMSDAYPRTLAPLSKLVLALAIALIVAGAVWHGVTFKTLERFWHDLVERPDGPMRFRFILQPIMATIAAVRDGVQDAHAGRSPYIVALLGNRGERIGLLNEGLNATARIMVLGLVMDVIYQVVALGMFYPVEALFVALLLAFVPYLIVRGLVVLLLRVRAVERRP
jgi:hypothetical protein